MLRLCTIVHSLLAFSLSFNASFFSCSNSFMAQSEGNILELRYFSKMKSWSMHCTLLAITYPSEACLTDCKSMITLFGSVIVLPCILSCYLSFHCLKLYHVQKEKPRLIIKKTEERWKNVNWDCWCINLCLSFLLYFLPLFEK